MFEIVRDELESHHPWNHKVGTKTILFFCGQVNTRSSRLELSRDNMFSTMVTLPGHLLGAAFNVSDAFRRMLPGFTRFFPHLAGWLIDSKATQSSPGIIHPGVSILMNSDRNNNETA